MTLHCLRQLFVLHLAPFDNTADRHDRQTNKSVFFGFCYSDTATFHKSYENLAKTLYSISHKENSKPI